MHFLIKAAHAYYSLERSAVFVRSLIVICLFLVVFIVHDRSELQSHTNSEDTEWSIAHGSRKNEAFHGTHSTCTDWTIPRAMTTITKPWYSMKAVNMPAECTVKGFSIETLDPDNNFRRMYTLGFTRDVEDKMFLLPFLRAAHDTSLQKRPRRVYLDLGGKNFESSVEWFMRQYPLDFTEVHVFEVRVDVFKIPERNPPGEEILEYFEANSTKVPNKVGPMPIPNWQLDRIKLYNMRVGEEDGEGKLNLTRFIVDELKLTADDALIIKMDIEGAEWSLLEGWTKNPQLSDIVDEIFVELHYSHPSMSKFGWTRIKLANGSLFPPREDALQLFNQLRTAGFYAHAWP